MVHLLTSLDVYWRAIISILILFIFYQYIYVVSLPLETKSQAKKILRQSSIGSFMRTKSV